VTAWLIAILTVLGALLLAMVKADLEDAKVCRWLARQLIYRAALRLPRGERARWREESIRDALDLPGRLPPLLWALDIYVRSGSWGRMRGAPSRSQALIARIRAAWQRLRSGPEPQAQELHPGPIQVQAQAGTAQVRAVALDASLVASGTTRSTGSVNLGSPRKVRVAFGGWRDGLMHLSDEDFIGWLAQQRQDFEDDLDRQAEAWRQVKAWRQAEAWRQRRA
jgi:hypothetical protein